MERGGTLRRASPTTEMNLVSEQRTSASSQAHALCALRMTARHTGEKQKPPSLTQGQAARRRADAADADRCLPCTDAAGVGVWIVPNRRDGGNAPDAHERQQQAEQMIEFAIHGCVCPLYRN